MDEREGEREGGREGEGVREERERGRKLSWCSGP